MKHLVKSIPKKGSLTNGDHHNFFEDTTVTIAVVADGVGGNACDWKASEQACEDLIAFYQNEYLHLGIKEGIAQSLRKTYERIYETKGKCEGMLTTLVAVIIDKIQADGSMIGRTSQDAPEIDGVIYLDKSAHDLAIGNVVAAKITSSDNHDLWGKITGV